jgi:hypothetical protein
MKDEKALNTSSKHSWVGFFHPSRNRLINVLYASYGTTPGNSQPVQLYQNC